MLRLEKETLSIIWCVRWLRDIYQIIPFAKEHDVVCVVSLTKVGFIAATNVQHLRLKTESKENNLLCYMWLQWQSRFSGVIANLVEHDNWRWKRSLLTFLVRDIHFKQQAELSFTKDTGRALTEIKRQRYTASDLNFDSGKKVITGLTYNKQLTYSQQDIFYTWWSCRLRSKSLHRKRIGYRENFFR